MFEFLNDAEKEVLNSLASKQGMSLAEFLRYASRLYQLVLEGEAEVKFKDLQKLAPDIEHFYTFGWKEYKLNEDNHSQEYIWGTLDHGCYICFFLALPQIHYLKLPPQCLY